MTIFNYLHNDIGYPHDLLAKHPEVMLTSKTPIAFRHDYLTRLGRNQYETDKPNYVSPMAFATTTDEEFAETVAKTSLEDYYKFLMTV